MNSIDKAVTTRTPHRIAGIVFVDPATGENINVKVPKEPKEADTHGKKAKGTGNTPATETQLAALADKFSK